jgi:hypothetical protein
MRLLTRYYVGRISPNANFLPFASGLEAMDSFFVAGTKIGDWYIYLDWNEDNRTVERISFRYAMNEKGEPADERNGTWGNLIIQKLTIPQFYFFASEEKYKDFRHGIYFTGMHNYEQFRIKILDKEFGYIQVHNKEFYHYAVFRNKEGEATEIIVEFS